MESHCCSNEEFKKQIKDTYHEGRNIKFGLWNVLSHPLIFMRWSTGNMHFGDLVKLGKINREASIGYLMRWEFKPRQLSEELVVEIMKLGGVK